MSKKTLITNAILVNEGRVEQSDLLVAKGRIERIDPSISADQNTHVIDANGGYLLPGMIDGQVHFRDPGLTHKGNIRTESRAAVTGGITSFMDMPNTNPQTITNQALRDKYAYAEGKAYGNYAFYLGATNDNLEEIRTLDPNLPCGVKVFMGASTGNMLVDNEETLDQLFAVCPVLLATHCENTPMIAEAQEAAIKQYGRNIPVTEHPRIRHREACLASSSLAVRLAKKHGTRLHVLHISTADELALFAKGDISGKPITGEACVHFLYFTDADYEALGNRIKCNPAIKSKSDRDAILAAVIDGTLDVVATDHAPHTAEEKAQEDYFKAPAGLPLVQWALPLLLRLTNTTSLTLERIVETTAHNVARRFQVVERGFLREGYWADLALVGQVAPYRVSDSDVLSRCGWTPFAGQSFDWRVEKTMVSGHLAWDGETISDQPAGRQLEFSRN